MFNSVTNFINGNVDSSARNIGNVANRINVGSLDFYGMDSFKFKPYLTLELGMRYAWNMTPTEASDRFLILFPVDLLGACWFRRPNLMPRATRISSLASALRGMFSIPAKLVLRAGYAYQVDEPITGVVTGLVNNNPAFVIPLSISAQKTLAATATLYNSPTPASIAPIFVDPNFKDANVQSWNLNIQHQLTRSSS